MDKRQLLNGAVNILVFVVPALLISWTDRAKSRARRDEA
jgi:hypothetical protein